MQYKENYDPGFQDLTPEDLEAKSNDAAKLELLTEIESQFTRLGVGKQQREAICHFQVGTTNLDMLPAFNLKMFCDYLSRLTTGSSTPF